MQNRHTRILPKSMATELRRLPRRVLGFVIFAATVGCWLALMSWSNLDPSMNNATDVLPRNWLGYRGAALSDAMFHAFGLASVLVIAPFAAFGWDVMRANAPLRIKWRLLCWLIAAFMVPAFFSTLPPLARWPLHHGLGGIVGDVSVARMTVLQSMITHWLLWPLVGLIFGFIGGVTLIYACGLRPKHLALIVKSGSNRFNANFGFESSFMQPTLSEKMGYHVSNFMRGFAPKYANSSASSSSRGAGEREFWMSQQRHESLFSRMRKGSWRSRAAVEEPEDDDFSIDPNAKMSPFADWGHAQDQMDGQMNTRFPFGAGRTRPAAKSSEAFSDVRIEPFFAGRTVQGGFDPRMETETAYTSRRPLPEMAAPNEDAVMPIRKMSAKAETMARRPAFDLKPHHQPTTIRDFNPSQDHDFNGNLPSLELLAKPRASLKTEADSPYLQERAAMLMDVLGDFGVKGRISGIYPGPVITLFELEPARGTKSSRVVGLADDIARSMSAVSARVAVVPGRDAIGIELPNPQREIVSLRGILEASAFQSTQAALPLALGKSIGGEPIVVDLARMPHLLIAGTTGSGKSVGINTMILSLLYRLPASQCNFIMIDPKMLELSIYDGIPHLLAPVVTDPKKAVTALKWTVREMGARYERMCKLGVRNITSYNAKVAAAALRGQPLRHVVKLGFDPRTDEPLEEEEIFNPEPMPYIVVVIDEMADLMMVAGKEIEFAVQRLSQMARAAGIHLIMATQRPSVDVVTGTIKANFPSRVSFQVTSKIDSRTIIGEQGAEQLLGAGDMLYMAAGGRIIRAHGPFVADEEVESIASYLKAQGVPNYRDDILEEEATEDLSETMKAGSNGDKSGDLYEQAVEIVLKDKKPTTSYLQRRLGIGYNRAASLIERMEHEGIIGAPSRTGRREILMGADQ